MPPSFWWIWCTWHNWQFLQNHIKTVSFLCSLTWTFWGIFFLEFILSIINVNYLIIFFAMNKSFSYRGSSSSESFLVKKRKIILNHQESLKTFRPNTIKCWKEFNTMFLLIFVWLEYKINAPNRAIKKINPNH